MRALVLLIALTACGAPPESAATWPEADALFRRDPRWLGADAAYSIDLEDGRVLWLFGDTFVATSDANVRTESEMVRNTVAITSRDPLTSDFEPHWRVGEDGTPASFFEEDGERWHWPGGGAVLADGSLAIFLSILEPSSEGLGFASAGWRVAIVDDPSAPLDAWAPRLFDPPAQAFDATAGTAVTRDGGYVVALATAFEGTHRGYLVRFTDEALAAGDLAAAEWWSGDAWVRQDALSGPPAVVIDDAAPESSISYDDARAEWIHVASYGFGATWIGVRRAPALTGPWSAAERVITPPESRAAEPFVYAAKAHPELVTPDGSLAITYAANSFDFWALFREEGAELYWPRFVRLPR